MSNFNPVSPPSRLLLGPGPSVVAPTVLEAMARPTLGHLDPAFLEIMDQVRTMLRQVFRTENEMTMPMSGTGSAGMETIFVNLVEAGDRVVVGVNGVFGLRMAEVARRCGAEVIEVQTDWGKTFSPDDFTAAADGKPVQLMAVVHAETSTGAHQDLSGFRAAADSCGALLCVDAVTSLGGVPLETDAWGLDAVYSGTQKCLSCPPGLSPITLGPRAVERLENRKTPVPSWYFDLSLIRKYWGEERAYHHTAPINMIYGLHEALRLVLDEGLEARFKRHQTVGSQFQQAVEELGFSLMVDESIRLPQLTSIRLPEQLNDAKGRAHLLQEHDIEIGGGLGPWKGQVWRVGLMGAGATPDSVERCLQGIRSALAATSA
ncbi:MAG: alanine--glyoxylate aminotransferase [Planctomycetota bacterium]|nr:MAG: alanine--glyoxylate aminotransferase [Planctomycetota bacterium]